MRRGLLLALLLLVPASMVVVGCGEEKSPERKEPFQPSSPPPGFIEERMKARENAPKPGPPSDAKTAPSGN